jgi:nucleotide-binding universal stress UspA family protein
MANEIVVGYDGTKGSNVALEAALALAKEVGATIVLAFGYEPSKFADQAGDYEEAVKQLGQRASEEGLAKAKAQGVPAEVAMVAGRAADALASLAEERDARMVVVGSNGEGPLVGAILGSTPYKLLHLTKHPVLVVPV